MQTNVLFLPLSDKLNFMRGAMMSRAINMLTVESVRAREIINGVGKPTIEVDVVTEGKAIGRASIPSGTSKGKFEAVELRDGGGRYGGAGVQKAVQNVNTVIANKIKGKDVTQQNEIDQVLIDLDGTPNKSRLGANALLGVSLAIAKAAAMALGIPLYRYLWKLEAYKMPTPIATIIAGGKYAGNELDFEDYLIFPIVPLTFREATQAIMEVYYALGNRLSQTFKTVPMIGTGYAPPLCTTSECLELICESCKDAGYEDCFALGLDAAASLFYDDDTQLYHVSGKYFVRTELLKYYENLVAGYPVRLLEDPFSEDDFDGFERITKTLKIQIVGDDLFATNKTRLEKGIKTGSANTLLLKLNQVGTLTEALEVAKLAFEKGYGVIVSARSGETNDTFIADLAVGIGAAQIKLGVPCRGERSAKYNRLFRIEEEFEFPREHS
jgi:enolase